MSVWISAHTALTRRWIIPSRAGKWLNGAYSPDQKVDYPIAGRKVAEAIRRGDIDKGVLVCGTGVGISLAANKVPGIRAGVCSDCFTAKMVKEHNHCQIIAMGQRVVGTELAKMIVDNFFEAEEQGVTPTESK